ncbi:MAG: hypothetical protein HOM55_07065 [Proteobacteria bacterium]|nr:hypothetical protein [Pseudomonadota bacterium]
MSFVLGRDVPDATGRVVVVGANGVIGYELCAGLTKIGRSLLPLRGASCLDLATSGSDEHFAINDGYRLCLGLKLKVRRAPSYSGAVGSITRPSKD